MPTQLGKCEKCSNDIRWVVMKKSGKRMPLDMGKRQIVTEDGETITGYESHFASCRFAKDFRRT